MQIAAQPDAASSTRAYDYWEHSGFWSAKMFKVKPFISLKRAAITDCRSCHRVKDFSAAFDEKCSIINRFEEFYLS